MRLPSVPKPALWLLVANYPQHKINRRVMSRQLIQFDVGAWTNNNSVNLNQEDTKTWNKLGGRTPFHEQVGYKEIFLPFLKDSLMYWMK